MQTVTALEVFLANERAVRDGSLLAMHPTYDDDGKTKVANCAYQDPRGYRCAIGVVLKDATLEAVHRRHLNEGNVLDLFQSSTIDILNHDEFLRLSAMQKLHDNLIDPARPFDSDAYLCALRAILVSDDPDAPTALAGRW